MQKWLDTIESVAADLRKGRMAIVVDDADRENEGDLIMAGEWATPQAVNFMARFGRGLICAPTTSERLKQLGIEQMVAKNRESFRTDFQVSVDAAAGITTGISAADRAHTIKVLADPTAMPNDLVQPGHVFPLRAKPGGVLQRSGHTEAVVDLVNLAGCRPIGVLCEIMNDDGTMARLPQLIRFARKHKLKICTIEALIKYRRQREKLVERVEVVKLPTEHGEFDLHLYRSKIDGQHHLALVRGDVAGGREVLVRVHSETSSARSDAIAAPSFTRRCGWWRKRAGVRWCTCARKGAASVWRQRSRPTNCRNRATTRSKPTGNWVTVWT
jgi:3,4-dihydroxy 2-butanone 4-phosphate synthase/GTP cyclohydrolase II